MLGGLVMILVCQLLGEVVVRLGGLPLPGPVVGMVLLLGWLAWRRPAPAASALGAGDALLRALPIFFIPSTVGLVAYGPTLAAQWLPAAASAFGSWLATFVLVGWVATWLRPRRPGAAGHARSPEAAA